MTNTYGVIGKSQTGRITFSAQHQNMVWYAPFFYDCTGYSSCYYPFIPSIASMYCYVPIAFDVLYYSGDKDWWGTLPLLAYKLHTDVYLGNTNGMFSGYWMGSSFIKKCSEEPYIEGAAMTLPKDVNYSVDDYGTIAYNTKREKIESSYNHSLYPCELIKMHTIDNLFNGMGDYLHPDNYDWPGPTYITVEDAYNNYFSISPFSPIGWFMRDTGSWPPGGRYWMIALGLKIADATTVEVNFFVSWEHIGEDWREGPEYWTEDEYWKFYLKNTIDICEYAQTTNPIPVGYYEYEE